MNGAEPPGTPEVLIVGGGLAGAAGAISLARGGRRVVLVEKESQPQHKVCGEFLSQEALGYLASLGIDPRTQGAAVLHSVRLAGRTGASTAPLPFAALSLTRRRLDEMLLQAAEAAGVHVLRGLPVHALERDSQGWRAVLQRGPAMAESLAAATAFLATGKHDLHGRSRPPGRQSGLVAFKMYWRLTPEQAAALAGHVELVLFPGGYAGLQAVEEGAANLCCLVERRQLRRLEYLAGSAGRWQALLAAMRQACPHLRQRLAGAAPLLDRPLALSAIPYGYVRRAAEGVWAIGDQAAVIPSFTGDGMSIALHSGCLAAEMYLSGATATSFQQRLHADLRSRIGWATALSRGLVNPSLQSLFASAVSLRPSLLGWVAGRTRIPGKALLAGVSAEAPMR